MFQKLLIRFLIPIEIHGTKDIGFIGLLGADTKDMAL
jgi:hypothetical protein